MAIKSQIVLLVDFKQSHGSGSSKSLVSSTVPHVSSIGKKLRRSTASHGPGCTKSCQRLETPYAAWMGAILPHAPLAYSHPRGESSRGRSRWVWRSPCPPPAYCHPDRKLPLPSLRCLRGRAACKKKNLWTFWMDLIPPKELCKRPELFVPIPSGVSVPPPWVPAVCTVLPCSRVVVNEVKQQVNKQANEPEVRSQVLPAALAGL